MAGFKESLDILNQKINGFFSFVGMKLKNFKNLTLGEQVSYCCVGSGMVLILVSVILFII